MWKYAALVSYVGTDFCGWQKQKGSAADGAPSIQATFEGALKRMTGEEASVVGSGRTDSGVHALGQVAHFVLKSKEWDPAIIQRGLNSILPTSIRVQAVQSVAIEFHAQRSATRKQYSYYFQQGACAIPHIEPFSWWIHKPLDVEAMQAGLQHLQGAHDFKPFQSSGAKPGPTVREILEARVAREPLRFPGDFVYPVEFVRVRIVGTGFLKQMVRGIAGTLLQIGEQRRSPECFREILATGDRRHVGPTAPARALWLEQVWYPEEFRLSWQ
jgi:tRNA pseudouridine38-40 synthase